MFMRTINLHMGDGFLLLEPEAPELLKKKLTYWHRALEYDERTHSRISSGSYRSLYTEDAILDPKTNQITYHIHTMPGFIARITKILTDEGYRINYIDERTPAPPYNLAKAIEGLRDYQLEAANAAIVSGGGIISCPTGWGKTYLMAALIKAFDRSQLIYRNTPLTVVVAADMDVCRKNYNDLLGMLSKDRELGLVMTGEKGFSDDVQVITFDSLHYVDPAEIGILIVDECISGSSLITTELGVVRIDEAEQLGCKYVLTSCGLHDTFKRIVRYYNQGTRTVLKIITNKGILICTPDHKIMTTEGWKQAKELTVLSRIKTSGSSATVLNVTDLSPVKVYDIEVEDSHCFYANGLLVHNCHMAATEKRIDMIMAATKAMKWGVSATPLGRYDGGDLMTEGLFGPIVYESTYQQGVVDGALVPIIVYWIEAPEPTIGVDNYLRYKTRLGKYNHGVEKNKALNGEVMRLMRLIPEKLQTLCIMPHMQQMNELRFFDKDMKIIHGETSADNLKESRYHDLYPVSKKDRQEIYDQMFTGTIRKLLATYVYKQGVNFPQLTVMICPGGGGSAIVAGQIPGRASRAGVEGKDKSYIIDFVHSWDTYDVNGKAKPGPILKDDKARAKVYRELGFEQITLKSIDDLPFLKGSNEAIPGTV